MKHRARRPASRSRILRVTRYSTEDDLKAFLREVVVVSQDLRDSMAAHGRHGDAVDKAVALVLALLVQTQARQKGRTRLRLDPHPPIAHYGPDRPSGRLPEVWAALS